MEFGLIGHPLTHSMSHFIHSKLYELDKISAEYRMLDLDMLSAEKIQLLKGMNGYNVTIPYKEAIIPYLDGLTEKAQIYKSVNTVAISNGIQTGYNTDVIGFMKSVEKLGACLSGKILILGCGGVARMVVTEAALAGGDVTLAVRESSKSKAEKLISDIKFIKKNINIQISDMQNIEGDFDLLINCTPSGMYPQICGCAISEEVIKRCKKVFDLIYNPALTQLLIYAEKYNIPYIGGMNMLTFQAAEAHRIWLGKTYMQEELDKITKEANISLAKAFPEPIALIGFMATGKTTIAGLLAKKLNKSFLDTDKEIEKSEDSDINSIFKNKGEAYFRKQETKTLIEAVNSGAAIISTGGGIPTVEENVKILKAHTKVVFIDTDFDIIAKRLAASEERPLAKNNAGLKELYDKRKAYYKDISDFTVDGNISASEQTDLIINWLQIK